MGGAPPSKRSAARELTEKRMRVRRPCGRSSNGSIASYLVVKRSCTGASQAPKKRIVSASAPVMCSIPSGSV
jgi:hypothetical protein